MMYLCCCYNKNTKKQNIIHIQKGSHTTDMIFLPFLHKMVRNPSCTRNSQLAGFLIRIWQKHYTEREKREFLTIVDKYQVQIKLFEFPNLCKAIIENKRTNAVTVEQKTVTWEKITQEYNSSAENPRSAKQLNIAYQYLKRLTRQKTAEDNIGPVSGTTWKPSMPNKAENNIAIHVTLADGEEEDEFVLPLQARVRRKLSSPLTTLPGTEDLLSFQNGRRLSPRSLSPLDRTKRRFSTMVSSAAASAVSRRLSATFGWCLAAPTQVKRQIVRQGRALCLQYIKTQIRRSATCPKKQIVMTRLQRMVESECGEEASSNIDDGVLAALRTLCAALERKRPEAFRFVARQATRAPSAMLRSDTALAELTLALARRITRENITWSKIAAVFCICGALAREAAEAANGEPPLDLVVAPAAAMADLLHEIPGSWIANHGGWTGLIDRLRTSERDQQSERNLRLMITVFILACISLILLRWVVRGQIIG